MKRHIFLALIALTSASSAMAATIASSSMFSDDPSIAAAGTKGIGFTFPNGGGATISGQYFLTKNTATRVNLGFALVRTDTGTSSDSTFNFGIEAGYRMYTQKVNSVAVFLQPSIFYNRSATASSSGGPGISVGAEYFFTSGLSLGVNTGVNLVFSNTFKDINFATGTSAITGTLYW